MLKVKTKTNTTMVVLYHNYIKKDGIITIPAIFEVDNKFSDDIKLFILQNHTKASLMGNVSTLQEIKDTNSLAEGVRVLLHNIDEQLNKKDTRITINCIDNLIYIKLYNFLKNKSM